VCQVHQSNSLLMTPEPLKPDSKVHMMIMILPQKRSKNQWNRDTCCILLLLTTELLTTNEHQLLSFHKESTRKIFALIPHRTSALSTLIG